MRNIVADLESDESEEQIEEERQNVNGAEIHGTVDDQEDVDIQEEINVVGFAVSFIRSFSDRQNRHWNTAGFGSTGRSGQHKRRISATEKGFE